MNWQRRSGGAPNEAHPPASLPPMPMPDAIWHILYGRGLRTAQEIESLYQPKLKDLAHPFVIDQMDVAVERLIKALQGQEKILLYADYDLDGTPGLTLLYDAFTRLGFTQLETFQPSRLREGYGVHADVLEKFIAGGVSLVVTVDVGITDIDAIAAAKKLGVDVIVTDHHLPKETLPEALAILNPNKGTCSSELQHLCGTGVAFYLVLALRMAMKEKNLLREDFDLKDLLDLFALATITDMVPLIKENRTLVKHGLKVLANTERPGLKELFVELGFYRKTINAQDVGFRIAPKLNALTRLDEGLRAYDVLTADSQSARARVQEALLINQRRTMYQQKAKEIAAEILKSQSSEAFIFLHSKDFHPGVISLLANDLMQQSGKPAFVGAVQPDGRVLGSARAKNENLQDVLGAAQSVLKKFGGHKQAAGFEFDLHDADKLSAAFGDYFRDAVSPVEDSASPIFYDAEILLSELNPSFMGWYDNMGPFGMGFPAPQLLLRNAVVKSVKKIKGQFLKYVFTTAHGELEAPWFNNPQEFEKGQRLDVLFEPQWNEFMGRRQIQGLVHAARQS